MRLLIALMVALPLTGCFPTKPSQHAGTVMEVAPVSEPPKVESSHLVVPLNPPRMSVRNISGIDFEGVAFDSRSHHLIVADQPGGPGSRYADSRSAASSLGGTAAMNAGFFTPEGAPLGLVVSSGKFSGSWNSASSLGSGIWYESPQKSMAITRRENLGRTGATAMRELIQAGPLLVENGRAVSGLEAAKSSARSVILWDGGSRWWMGCSSACTLADLGRALATSGPSDWPVRQALNLDGGRSSDLWISNAMTGGPLLRRPPWNRPVRNFIVLVAR